MARVFLATFVLDRNDDTAHYFAPFCTLNGQVYKCQFYMPLLEMPPRRFKTTHKRRAYRKSICPCSPDVGDCPRCHHPVKKRGQTRRHHGLIIHTASAHNS